MRICLCAFSVCRLWRSLSVAAWQHVCVDEDRAPRFESFHLTYLAGARSLQSTTALSLAHCSALCDRAVSLAWTHMPDLTQLDLSHCDQLTDNALQALATAPGEWKRAAEICSGAVHGGLSECSSPAAPVLTASGLIVLCVQPPSIFARFACTPTNM